MLCGRKWSGFGALIAILSALVLSQLVRACSYTAAYFQTASATPFDVMVKQHFALADAVFYGTIVHVKDSGTD